MWVRIAVVLSSLTVSAAAGEVALRLWHPVAYRQTLPPPTDGSDPWRDLLHRPSEIPGLSYELAPGMEKRARGTLIRTNSLGMRDDEPLPDDESLFRIAVLGDSFTFGFGVTAEEAYPNALESLLRERAGSARTWEVLNFGVGGYSTRDELAVLKHKAAPLRPQAIVLGYVLNDAESDPAQPLHQHFHRPDPWERSHLARLVAQAINDWESRGFSPTGDYIRDVNSHPGKWRRNRRALRDISVIARRRVAPCVAVIFPMQPPGGWTGWSAYPYRELHERVSDCCDREGYRVIDLLDAYSAFPPSEVMGSNAHPTALGHRIAAEQIAEVLLGDRALLPATADRRDRALRGC